MKGLNSGFQDIVPVLSTGVIFITYRYGKYPSRAAVAQTRTDSNSRPTTACPCAHPKGNRDENGDPPPLGADMVFAVLGLTQCLMRCFGFQLPQFIQTASECLVSIERIRDFLILPDKTTSRLLEDAPTDPRAVVGSVTNMSARYETGNKSVMSVKHTPPSL